MNTSDRLRLAYVALHRQRHRQDQVAFRVVAEGLLTRWSQTLPHLGWTFNALHGVYTADVEH